MNGLTSIVHTQSHNGVALGLALLFLGILGLVAPPVFWQRRSHYRNNETNWAVP